LLAYLGGATCWRCRQLRETCRPSSVAERLEHQAWLRTGRPAGEQVLGQLTLPMLGDNILRCFAATWAAWSGAVCA
jgi:hypothetical protein